MLSMTAKTAHRSPPAPSAVNNPLVTARMPLRWSSTATRRTSMFRLARTAICSGRISKTYAIVDVGAGTTEVSFFFNGKAMAQPGQPYRPSCLADSTEAVGGGKIDIELAQAWDCGVEEARRRKESGLSPLPMVSSIGEIRGQYERTCCEILKEKKLIAPHDKRFDLFVIGGGGRLPPLRAVLQGHPLPGSFVRDHLLPLRPPRSLKNRVDLQKDYDFLANACGLASSLDLQHYPPREVRPMAQLPTKPKQDVEEYYPK